MKMNILITGSKGFIGKNLLSELRKENKYKIFEYNKDDTLDYLKKIIKEVNLIFHFAGVNRPNNLSEFMEGNYELTRIIAKELESNKNKCPIVLTSSIQAELDNPYGRSKLEAENVLKELSLKNGNNIYIYRLTNVFGKWSKPNYNSVIATFCHNINNDIPISIHNPNNEITLLYIDDLVKEFLNLANNKIPPGKNYYNVTPTYNKTIGQIASYLYHFKNIRNSSILPDLSDDFIKKLYSTYLSFLPKNKFSYKLNMNKDSRGSFTELIKSSFFGQVSVNISKPGITKGNHWHHTKVEKFIVVSGKAIIRFRKIDSSEIIEYIVSSNNIEVVDIPPGYTHNIENVGDTDLVTVMWANEPYDMNDPDTTYLML